MQKRLSLVVLTILSLNFSINAAKLENSDYVFLTVGSDSTHTHQKAISNYEVVSTQDDISVIKILRKDVEELSHHMHEDFNRCGGFIAHDSEQEAIEEQMSDNKRLAAKSLSFVDYSLTEESSVKSMINVVSAQRIEADIRKLSSYKTRHHKSSTGLESQEWILNKWKAMASRRNDIEVSYFEHDRTPQPSVIMKIKGKSEDAIIVGGHGDSTASSFWGGSKAEAPGADDNASGIATINEIIKILLDSSFVPQNTIYFISYAAEEVGLVGSKHIAQDFSKRGVNVVGVLQLDMTNFKGSSKYDIVMMTDYTNDEQNKFLGTLIEKYLPNLKWGFDKCGYGCSDHASWHGEGFPASVPFESRKNDMNRKIHTKNDVIDLSGGHAEHAQKFAKLGIAYVIELDR